MCYFFNHPESSNATDAVNLYMYTISALVCKLYVSYLLGEQSIDKLSTEQR